jgi:hypothetical protein
MHSTDILSRIIHEIFILVTECHNLYPNLYPKSFKTKHLTLGRSIALLKVSATCSDGSGDGPNNFLVFSKDFPYSIEYGNSFTIVSLCSFPRR